MTRKTIGLSWGTRTEPPALPPPQREPEPVLPKPQQAPPPIPAVSYSTELAQPVQAPAPAPAPAPARQHAPAAVAVAKVVQSEHVHTLQPTRSMSTRVPMTTYEIIVEQSTRAGITPYRWHQLAMAHFVAGLANGSIIIPAGEQHR